MLVFVSETVFKETVSGGQKPFSDYKVLESYQSIL